MSVIDDLLVPQFSTGIACEASGVSLDTFRNWFSRKPPAILLAPAEREEVGGRTIFKLTLQSVYHLAIVRELVARGFEPRRAHEMASAFTLFGDGKGSHEPADKKVREPGNLYDDGYTYLIGCGQGGSYTVQVDPAKTTLFTALVRAEEQGGAAAVVRIDPIIWRTRAALGLTPRPGQA